MRLIPLIPAVFIVCSGLAYAQEWTDYVSKQDFFSISFPGQPSVQETTYPTEYRITLPARVYTQQGPRGKYSVTVVDYRNAVKLHQERIEKCKAAGGDGDQCQDDGSEEVRGAIVFASWNFMNRTGVKVTHYAHYNSDVIEGHEIHLMNPDGSRTFGTVHMHEDRLYILEATVPKGAPPPGLFQISMRFLDEQGNGVRYQWVGTQMYINGYPKPPRAGRGGQGQGQGGRGQGQGRGQQN